MPSSLERFISLALVHLHPPTCVGLRYERQRKHMSAFLGGRSGDVLRPKARLPIRSGNHFSIRVPNMLDRHRRRNINLLCIDYAHRPRLSSRLTLGGRTCPRKPWVYGDQNSRLVYRYSCLHAHWPTLHFQLPSSFAALVTLSYHLRDKSRKSVAAVCRLIANHFRRDITR